jgi:hypothetical protein
MDVYAHFLGFIIIVSGVFATMLLLRPVMQYALKQKWGDRRLLFVVQLFLISAAFVGVYEVFRTFVPNSNDYYMYLAILVGPIIGNMSVVSL